MLDGTQAKYGDIMNDMNLMDELLKIPADATAATVQGIEMLLIDENKAGALLESDPNDNTIHECLFKQRPFPVPIGQYQPRCPV
ncbi:hypothetical protein NIB75_10740 [Bacteroides uniformis]|nr:hypothetical protein [Bacteroides uniformis]